jgi:hypothetical protein
MISNLSELNLKLLRRTKFFESDSLRFVTGVVIGINHSQLAPIGIERESVSIASSEKLHRLGASDATVWDIFLFVG